MNLTYPLADNEAERLAALAALGILDTPPKAEFENLIELARELLDAPIALVSHLDAERQWFSAACGLSAKQTSREDAFCNYPVAANKTFLINDAMKDPRFANNPLVTGAPHVRFYVGVPLCLTPGVVIATLCVIDTRPRRISASKLKALDKLAQVAERLLAEHASGFKLQAAVAQLAASRLLVENQARSLELQNRILTNASALAKMGAWEYDVATDEYNWSDGMYAIHEVDPSFRPTRESISALYAPDQRAQIAARIRSAQERGVGDDFEAPIITPGGKAKWLRMTSHVETADGVPVRRFGLKQDITEDREARLKIEWLASRDSLTGLINRSQIELVAGQFAKHGRPYSLILIDLDGFKDINDTYGHPAGDACLKSIAQTLESVLKDQRLGRVGGDEFAILVEGPIEQAEATARLVSDCIARPIAWESHEFRLSASLGIATHQNGTSYADLMRNADLALYASKGTGRNLITAYHPGLSQRMERRVAIVGSAREALARGEFSVFYQPKFALATGQPAGFEALMRWNRDGNALGPGAFREALDDPALGAELGSFVVGEVIGQAARWASAGKAFRSIAINFGTQELRDAVLITKLEQMVQAAGLRPEMFEVEVTEDVFLSSANINALEICTDLRIAGFTVAFDDFGTGYASLTHLREFPINVIKIDQSFVGQLETDAGATSIVWAMVNLCHKMGLEVVAEGIETQGQLDYLRSIGCDYGQGYLLGRPVPASELTFRGSTLCVELAPGLRQVS